MAIGTFGKRFGEMEDCYTVSPINAAVTYNLARTGGSPVWAALSEARQKELHKVIQQAYLTGVTAVLREEGLKEFGEETITSHDTPSASTSQERAEPSLEEVGEAGAWSREKIFEEVGRVRRQRHEQYNKGEQSRLLRNFDAVGAVWSGLLSSWLQQTIPPIPGWLFSLMMAALKLARVTWSPDLDSFVDAINYTALAEECKHEEATREV